MGSFSASDFRWQLVLSSGALPLIFNQKEDTYSVIHVLNVHDSCSSGLRMRNTIKDILKTQARNVQSFASEVLKMTGKYSVRSVIMT